MQKQVTAIDGIDIRVPLGIQQFGFLRFKDNVLYMLLTLELNSSNYIKAMTCMINSVMWIRCIAKLVIQQPQIRFINT